jgi:hypothetical protein
VYPAFWILVLAFGLLWGGMVMLNAEGKEEGPRPVYLLLIGLGLVTLVAYWSLILTGG